MQFSLLGPLEVRVGEHLVPVRGDKQRSVLAMLLLAANRVVSADVLVDGLWGYRPPPGARGTIQSHVSHLRRSFEAGGIPASRLTARSGGYELRVGADELDVTRFEGLVESAGQARDAGDVARAAILYREARGLWRGPALGDVDLPLMRGQVARLEELELVAAEESFDCELALGRHAAVVAELEQLTAAHPLRERLWGQRMVALYRCGRQADALRTYRTLRTSLGEELGIEPSPSLRQLEQDILLQSANLDVNRLVPTAARSDDRASPFFSSQFVGRQRELKLLHEWLGEARLGRGRLVVLVGEPGIGKTALARALSAGAEEAGVAVHWGRCWEEEGAPPFWPWTELLRSFLASHPDDKRRLAGSAQRQLLAQLVPELDSAGDGFVAEQPTTDARFRLFEVVTDLLVRRGEPTVLVIEDLHAADEPSLLLLRFLARQLVDAPVLLLATARPVLSPGTPPAGLFFDVGREAPARRLDLGPLADDAAAQLLARELGSEGDTAEVAAIVRARGEGNPFFLLELARLVTSARARGSEHAAAASASGIPLGVEDMVRRRLATLGDDTAQVLALAAVVGRESSVDLLCQATSLTPDRVVVGLEDAVHAGLVEERPGRDRFRFCHALVREVLYEGLSAMRRARLHGRIAEAIEAGALGHPDTRLFELAHHCAAAGAEIDLERTVQYAVRAAERAGRQLAFEEAARGYEVALGALERRRPDSHLRAGLEMARADALVQAGQVGRAREGFEGVARRARTEGDGDLLARAALGLGRAFEARATDETLIGLLEEALRTAPPEATLRARLLARLAMALYFGGSLERRAQLSREAVELAEQSGDTGTLAFALNAQYFALWDPWHLAERQATARRALQLAEDLGDGELVLDALTWRVMDTLECGDMAEGGQAMRRHAHLADALRHPRHRSYATTWRAMRALLQGRFSEAERLANGAFELGREITDLAWPRLMVQLFVVRREQGRLLELKEDVDRVVTDHRELESAWRGAQGLVWEQAGDQAGARDILDHLLVDDTMLHVCDANSLIGMALAAELCASVGTSEQAETLAKALTPFADRCAVVRFAPVCLGAVSRYLGLLAAMREDWEQARCWFEHALILNSRMGAEAWVAHTEHDYALTLARQGRPGDAARVAGLARRAAATARQRGMENLLAAVEASGLAR